MSDAPCLRFQEFELDLERRELRKHGLRVKLQERPLLVLQALLERPGEVVTREELRARLWGEGVFVDFENGLNTAVNRLRETLGDTGGPPRFIETVPRRGYRFLARLVLVEAPHRRRRPPWTLLTVTTGLMIGAVGYWLSARERNGFDRPLTLVVLPFDNASGDPTDDYLSEGLTDELIAELARLRPERLSVVARASARQLKSREAGIADIGRELGAQYVLEGSVRRRGDRVRVVAQLANVATETELWAETYERDLADTIAVQIDLARRVARSLELSLLDRGFSPAPARSPEAYEAYLRGRYFLRQHTADGFQKAIDSFRRALALDPGYAEAQAGIASAYTLMSDDDFLAPRDALPLAEAAARRAVEMDGGLAVTHAALGYARLFFHWDREGAEKELRKAIALDPAYATARTWYAGHLSSRGRHEDALAEARLARQLEPLSLNINADLGWRLFFARRFDEAVEQYLGTLELEPRFARAHDDLGWVQVLRRKEDEAFASFRQAQILSGATSEEVSACQRAYGVSGLRGAFRWGLERMEERARSGSYVSPYDFALLYAAMGDKGRALDWLDRALSDRDEDLLNLKVDPRLDSLRGEARFDDLVRRWGSS